MSITKNNNSIQVVAPKSDLHFYFTFCGIAGFTFLIMTGLAFFQYGFGMGIFMGLVTSILVVVFKKMSHLNPTTLNLYNTYLTYAYYNSTNVIQINYLDIVSLTFSDFSSKNPIRDYYLVANCTTGKIYKIPLHGYTKSKKEQVEIIEFILKQNPVIEFSYRLNRYENWENVRK